MLKRNPELPLTVRTGMSCNVGILKVFPGITDAAVSTVYTPFFLALFHDEIDVKSCMAHDGTFGQQQS